MSSSFNAKNLHYDKKEPAFLQRLRANHDALDGRNTVQISRPQKSRLKTSADGDEDLPVIVDGNGEVVGRREFEGMVNGVDGGGDAGDEKAKGGDPEGSVEGDERGEVDVDGEGGRGTKVGIGSGTRKRKVVRVVGGDDDYDREASGTSLSTSKVETKPSAETKTKTKTKTKAKKIKLSFDDET